VSAEEYDLGALVAENLKPSAQCIKAAASVLRLVKSNFRKLDTGFLIPYKTYIRPHME